MTATQDQIVWHFINMRDTSGNWGTCECHGAECKWNVDADTYINGIVVTVDGDYYMGYLLEVVERESSVVSYVTIVTFYGPKLDSDGDVISQDHDSMWHPADCGTFFDRKVQIEDAAMWGVRTVYGLWESHDDRQRAKQDHPSSPFFSP
jgi:hypothetical protein